MYQIPRLHLLPAKNMKNNILHIKLEGLTVTRKIKQSQVKACITSQSTSNLSEHSLFPSSGNQLPVHENTKDYETAYFFKVLYVFHVSIKINAGMLIILYATGTVHHFTVKVLQCEDSEAIFCQLL
jgi:phage-related protein